MVAEQVERDREGTQRWLAALESPTELLVEAVRRDIQCHEELEALDRVPEEDLPRLVEVVAEHLPGRMADAVGQLLLLQVPDLMAEHADRLSDDEPYLWHDTLRDGDRSMLLLPAHHLAFPGDAVEVSEPAGLAALTTPSPTWWPRTDAVGAGRVGGAAEGRCPVCDRPLQRLIDLGTFASGGVSLPREIVLCPTFGCLWGEQFFGHDDGGPRPLPREATLPEVEIDEPQGMPELPVTFHRAPARWQVQDWAQSNDRQNLNRLGGAASWVQDSAYPECPRCSRSMPFLLQVDGGTRFTGGGGWEAWTEGMIYAFWCGGCRVSAVSSQQT